MLRTALRLPQTITLYAKENIKMEWQKIETAPKDGTYILLLGDSGYTTTPHRVMVGCYAEGYRDDWINHANDRVTDGGSPPTHWAPLPQAPKSGGSV